MSEPASGGAGEARREAAEAALTAWVGMVVFVGSASILFAAAMVAYASLRSRSPGFRPRGTPSWPLAMAICAAVVLVLIPVALRRAARSEGAATARQPEVHRARADTRPLACATALGALFVALQSGTAAYSWNAGLRPATCTYGALLYALYALHGAHVAAGTIALGWVTATAQRRAPNALMGALAPWRLYFRFVAALWFALVALVYLE